LLPVSFQVKFLFGMAGLKGGNGIENPPLLRLMESDKENHSDNYSGDSDREG
jgi:hypothetical protein